MSEHEPIDTEKSGEDVYRVRCRYYENQYPEPEEVVMVNVTQIGEMGAYVTLLEYDNIEGMILLSELSRRRIRSINKLVRVGRTEIVMVIRVDKEKGYIDLSKRRVEAEDVVKCEERFNKAKAVHSVMKHIAEAKKKPLEEVYQQIGWPLYRKYKHAYDAFKLVLSLDNQEDIFEGLSIDEDTKELVLNFIKRKLAPQPIKIRADIELTCFTYEGIDAIKAALMAGEAKSVEGAKVLINLVAPPTYVLTTMTLDKDLGIETLKQVIEEVGAVIRAKGGVLEEKAAPRAVTLREESELQAMLDRLALEQEEVDGDAPEDD